VGTVFPAGSIAIRWKNSTLVESNVTPVTATSGFNHIDLPNTPAAMNSFSGTLKDSDNAPITNVNIELQDTYGNSVDTTTGSGGAFNVLARPGTYTLKIANTEAPGITGFILEQSSSTPLIDLSTGNVSQDFVLEVGTVQVKAYTTLGNVDMYTDVRFGGIINTSITLAQGYDFNVTSSSGSSRTNHLGESSFKSIIGMTYAGTSTGGRICTYDYPSLGTCNNASLTVASGVNPTILDVPASY
jgi:hypothetical protein